MLQSTGSGVCGLQQLQHLGSVTGSQAPECKLSSDAQAQVPQGVWDFPRPGSEPMVPALAGRFLSTGPPGSPLGAFIFQVCCGLSRKMVGNVKLQKVAPALESQADKDGTPYTCEQSAPAATGCSTQTPTQQ